MGSFAAYEQYTGIGIGDLAAGSSAGRMLMPTKDILYLDFVSQGGAICGKSGKNTYICR